MHLVGGLPRIMAMSCLDYTIPLGTLEQTWAYNIHTKHQSHQYSMLHVSEIFLWEKPVRKESMCISGCL